MWTRPLLQYIHWKTIPNQGAALSIAGNEIHIFPGSSVCDSLCYKSKKSTPESFKKILHKIGKEILKDDNFGELLCHRNASPIIQTTLLTLKENDLKLSSKICNLVVQKSKLLEWKTDHEVDIASSNARYFIIFHLTLITASSQMTFKKKKQ